MQEKKELTVHLRYYAVGLFDLLEQQQRLSSLVSFPAKSDEQHTALVAQVIRDTYGAVLALRDGFRDSINDFVKSNYDVSDLTENQLQQFRLMNNNPIYYQTFSDTVIVFLSLKDTETAMLPERGIFGILVATALNYLDSMGKGHPVRGGIDVGIAHEIEKEKEIYGPALASAHTLESKVAGYPRVVIGDTLAAFLDSVSVRASLRPEVIQRMGVKLTDQCKDLIGIDQDGRPFLDYLGPGARKTFEITPNIGVLVDRAYEQVVKFSERFRNERDSKLAFRYSLLKDYFEDRLPLWQDAPRN